MRRDRATTERATLFGVSALALVVYLAILPWWVERLNPLTGDEPFYVMTAISIVRDRDLDESNNYANRDYLEFYPDLPVAREWRGWPSFPVTLPPHPAVSERDGLHTKHGLGLSFLIAIPYGLAGRLGAVLVIALGASALTGQMYLLGRSTGASRSISAVVSSGLALTMPLAPYALLIFPEIPAALLLMYSVRRIAARHNHLIQWVLAGTAIGYLPWLHQRFAPSAAVLGLVVTWRLLRSRTLGWDVLAVVPVAAGAASLLAYNWRLYRSPVQNVEDHAGFSGLTGTLNGAYGLLLDAQWGALITAPILVIAACAVPFWLRTDRHTALLAFSVAVPYLSLVAAYRVWWGEWGPPARYLVPIVPFAAGPLAAWLRSTSVPMRLVSAGAWTLGFAVTVAGVADPQHFYHHPNGWNKLWARVDSVVGTNVAERLVAFQPYALSPFYDRATAAILLTSLLLVVLVTMYVPLAFARHLPDNPHRSIE